MHKYIIPVALLMLPSVVNAQGKAKKIKCTVTNEEGQPVRGVVAVPHGTVDTLTTGAGGVFTVMAAEAIQVALYADGYHEEHILVSPNAKCTAQLRKDEEAGFDVDDTEE